MTFRRASISLVYINIRTDTQERNFKSRIEPRESNFIILPDITPNRNSKIKSYNLQGLLLQSPPAEKKKWWQKTLVKPAGERTADITVMYRPQHDRM
mmetsp:Transcript_11636/g.16729  ORF Transcript_11636/g.16729 Transcript_11636/m.16729 type:complete len:97 (+) Transcript_11636:84-374(+)